MDGDAALLQLLRQRADLLFPGLRFENNDHIVLLLWRVSCFLKLTEEKRPPGHLGAA